MLALGGHHSLKFAGSPQTGIWVFNWDVLASLFLLWVSYVTLSRMTGISRAARLRWRIAFVFAFLGCVALSFEKVYIDDIPTASASKNEHPGQK